MLERLLRNLPAQETGGLFDFSVVVVDNDPAAPAGGVVARLTAELGLDIVYIVSTKNIIPVARNHALRLAHGNYIGIIDDDEFPPPHWLLNLYRAIHTFDVDGALGPVHPCFDQRPPGWLIKGRFCERPALRTGTLLHWNQTRTGNVLLKREVFEKHNLQFDETFTTGGSDREFFKHAMARGCRFIAVEQAPVYEIVPPERWTMSYWLRRAVVNGYNAHKNNLGQVRGLARAILPLKLAAASVVYAGGAPLAACLGTHHFVRCLESGGNHFSRLCAMFGIELVKQRDF